METCSSETQEKLASEGALGMGVFILHMSSFTNLDLVVTTKATEEVFAVCP